MGANGAASAAVLEEKGNYIPIPGAHTTWTSTTACRVWVEHLEIAIVEGRSGFSGTINYDTRTTKSSCSFQPDRQYRHGVTARDTI